MSTSRLGAQIYTIRDSIKTLADFTKSMETLKQMGYEAIQLSGQGPMVPADIHKVLADNGIKCVATHTDFAELSEQTQKLIDELKILECEHTAIASMPGEFRSAEGYAKFAHEASEKGRVLKDAGIGLSYHNHSFEFIKYGDKTGLEILRDESDPNILGFEIDTYWIQHGGGDPAAWIKSVKGRIPLVHLKDMTMSDDSQIMAEVGEGNLNWPAILDACKEAGVEWYLVEQDTCQRDPFDSLKISLDNLKGMGL